MFDQSEPICETRIFFIFGVLITIGVIRVKTHISSTTLVDDREQSPVDWWGGLRRGNANFYLMGN